MKTLYFFLAMAILAGMTCGDAALSLASAGCALGMYMYFKNQRYGKDGKNRGSSQTCQHVGAYPQE